MDVYNLLQQEESHLLEFKENFDSTDSLAGELVAFSNSKGGKIIVGVKDKTKKIVGIDLSFDFEEFVMNVATHNCTPIISPLVEFYTIDGKTICVIAVFSGKLKPYYVTKRGAERGTLIRIGSSNKPADKAWIQQLSRESRNLTFDRLEVTGACFGDFDLDKIKRFQKRKMKKLGALIEEIDIDYLKKLGCYKIINGNRFPTIGGLLVFGTGPQNTTGLIRAEVKCARFKGNEKGLFIDQSVISGTIDSQIDDTVSFILKNTRMGGIIKGIKREDIPEYPMIAIREAVTNALVHRDYFVSDSKAITVAIFDDRIEIESPGILPLGVELEGLGKQQKTRNPLISKLLFDMDYFDEWGQGIIKMRKEMADANLPGLVFKENFDCFVVTLFGPGDEFMR